MIDAWRGINSKNVCVFKTVKNSSACSVGQDSGIKMLILIDVKADKTNRRKVNRKYGHCVINVNGK